MLFEPLTLLYSHTDNNITEWFILMEFLLPNHFSRHIFHERNFSSCSYKRRDLKAACIVSGTVLISGVVWLKDAQSAPLPSEFSFQHYWLVLLFMRWVESKFKLRNNSCSPQERRNVLIPYPTDAFYMLCSMHCFGIVPSRVPFIAVLS